MKERYPEKNIWCYSGYLFDEELKKESRARCEYTDEMLSMLDVLVDGRFEEDKKNITLLFRGSENQRLIDVKKSLEQDKVVEWKPAIKEDFKRKKSLTYIRIVFIMNRYIVKTQMRSSRRKRCFSESCRQV